MRLIVKAPKWQLDELHDDRETAQRRLQELAAYRDRPANVVSFSGYTALAAPPDRRDGGRMPEVVAAWDRFGHRFNGEFAGALDEIGLLDRAIVLRQGADAGLYYAFIGDGHCRRFGRAWVRRSLGRRHDAVGQHDEAYSAWCAHHYADAVSGDVPRRHFVDAVIASLDPDAPRDPRELRSCAPPDLPGERQACTGRGQRGQTRASADSMIRLASAIASSSSIQISARSRSPWSTEPRQMMSRPIRR
ncbi:hypothetical protein [Tistlia consotensis]|uniref:hypothetical protein n=1 Tax=Tistlia consotensis TaxID=1321365 RepID=UPI00135660FA|nr:hypothetical protein [Tistlia consotensis]